MGRGLHTVPLCALPRHASVGSREQSSGRSPHRVAPRAPWGRRAAPVAPQLGGVQGGGGSVGGPLVPWRCLLTAGGGGGMAVLAPGASHRLGGRALPPPPST